MIRLNKQVHFFHNTGQVDITSTIQHVACCTYENDWTIALVICIISEMEIVPSKLFESTPWLLKRSLLRKQKEQYCILNLIFFWSTYVSLYKTCHYNARVVSRALHIAMQLLGCFKNKCTSRIHWTIAAPRCTSLIKTLDLKNSQQH